MLLWAVSIFLVFSPLIIYHTRLFLEKIRLTVRICTKKFIFNNLFTRKRFVMFAFTCLIIFFLLSIILVLMPHNKFPYKSYRWGSYVFNSPDYDWYIYLASYAPILLPSFIFCLMIILKTLERKRNRNDLLVLTFSLSLVAYFTIISIIVPSNLGLYYSGRVITEWMLASIVYFVTILICNINKTFDERGPASILMLAAICLSLPGPILYSHYIATYNPLFNKLDIEDITALQQLRCASNNGTITLVLPLDEDLEYLSNYLAAVPTYTIHVRKNIVQQLRQEESFTGVVDILKRYKVNALIAWREDKIIPLFNEYCNGLKCSLISGSNIVIVYFPTLRFRNLTSNLFIREHSELWAIKP